LRPVLRAEKLFRSFLPGQSIPWQQRPTVGKEKTLSRSHFTFSPPPSSGTVGCNARFLSHSKTSTTFCSTFFVFYSRGMTFVCLVFVLLVSSTCAQESWVATGSLNTARGYHTANLLPSDEVLVVGGKRTVSGSSTVLSSAELYNPTSGVWRYTGSLSTARTDHTSTLLRNGQVMVQGGSTVYGSDDSLYSCELYNPTSGSWTTTGRLTTARSWHTATLLQTGEVLVAGGTGAGGSNGYFVTTELYSSSSRTWTPSGSLNTARAFHTATLLLNGMVVVAGGSDYYGALNSAEIYNPTSRTWSIISALNVPRFFHTATLLDNGMVLVTDGEGSSGASFDTCELYNPTTNTWAFTGNAQRFRSKHTATLLQNGQVLIAAGAASYSEWCELYEFSTGSWAGAGRLVTTNFYAHTATLLSNGHVLLAGGMDWGTFLPLAAAQIYKPGLATPAPTDPRPSDIVTDPSDDSWIIAVAVVVPIIGIAAIGVAVFLYVRHRKLTGGTILSLI